MDLYRQIGEGLRKLQQMDGLTEEEFYKKKTALMRKMTKKQTKHIYDKDKSKDKKLSVEQKLVKYAASLKYDPNKQR